MCRVLIVDDDQTMRKGLRYLLEATSDDYDVEEAASAESAFERVKQGGFHLMLVDIRMPGLEDGIILSRRVREIEQKGVIQRVGIIVITAFADFENAKKAVNEGQVDGLFEKPIDSKSKDALIAQIEKHRRRSHEDDDVTRAFAEWINGIDADKFKIEKSGSDGKTRTLTARDVLEEMRKGTQFGLNFKKSILRVTTGLMLKSTTSKHS